MYSFEGNRLRIHHTCQAGKGVLETVGVRLLAQIRAKILAEDEFVAVLPGTADMLLVLPSRVGLQPTIELAALSAWKMMRGLIGDAAYN